MEVVNSVRKQWEALCAQLYVDQSFTQNWWDTLSQMYGSAPRFYHTLQHIGNMLALFNTITSLICNQTLVLLAIFFHDSIYEPKQGDNEEQSAKLFQDFAKKVNEKDDGSVVLDSSNVDTVSRWILQTKSHSLSHSDLTGTDCDESLFLDLDLSILGAEAHVYEQYSHNIRREYNFYELQAYRIGRSKILSSFLERQRIYYSSFFHNLFEVQARANLSHELAFLQSDSSLNLDRLVEP